MGLEAFVGSCMGLGGKWEAIPSSSSCLLYVSELFGVVFFFKGCIWL